MSVLYAKLKRSENPDVIVFSHMDAVLSSLFNFTVDEHIIEYDCNGAQLADDEHYSVQLTIEQWSEATQLYHTSNTSTADLNTTGFENEYQRIQVLYRVDQNGVSFKKITQKNLIGSRGVIAWEHAPRFETPSNKIAVGSAVDLYIDTTTRKVYFRSFRDAQSILPVLREFYAEATQEETDIVLSSVVFDISELDTTTVGQRNRKRIAFVTKELGIDLTDSDTIGRIKTYSEKYDMGEVFQDEKLKVSSNAELTRVLDIISGAFFQNEITGDLMKATTTKKL